MVADRQKLSLLAIGLLAVSASAACEAELRAPGPTAGPRNGAEGPDPSVSGDGDISGDGDGDGGGPGPDNLPPNATPEDAAEAEAGSRFGLAARLGKFEYQNSVQDVLGVTLLPEELDDQEGGIPDDTGDGVFKHLADNQTSVEQHAEAYFRVAEGLAQRVDIAGLHEEYDVCQDAGEVCGGAFIDALGRRLYRRPLTDREKTTILNVYEDGIEVGLEHEEATRWSLVALLQAPQFLFRMENELEGTPGTPRQLNGYEFAARLASFLWISVPDEELLTAAANGSLLSPDVLSGQIERMLSDEKARRLTQVFATDFSRARFSSFEGATDADRAALNESIIATFQDHFWEQGGGISDLFTTTRFIVNPTVAELLGITMSGTGLEAVDVSELPHRIGLMSHPAMIAGMGDLVVGSFVNRGKYLMERLLCEHPTAFPGDITTEIDNFNTETAGLNERERAEVRMTRTVCWNCHKQFEPLAFGFARFDGAGRYVGEMDADGKPLPLDGWVPTREEVEPPYEDVASYMQILATNDVVQTCMTEHFLDFATSRIGDAVGKTEAELIGEEYHQTAGTLADMIHGVVGSHLFGTILPSEGAQP